MKRLSYKSMYLKEKNNKETYKDTLDKIIETLNTFDNIKITDTTGDSICGKTRYIEIRQHDKFLQIAFNLNFLEENKE